MVRPFLFRASEFSCKMLKITDLNKTGSFKHFNTDRGISLKLDKCTRQLN
jgi:hypothetical protein